MLSSLTQLSMSSPFISVDDANGAEWEVVTITSSPACLQAAKARSSSFTNAVSSPRVISTSKHTPSNPASFTLSSPPVKKLCSVSAVSTPRALAPPMSRNCMPWNSPASFANGWFFSSSLGRRLGGSSSRKHPLHCSAVELPGASSFPMDSARVSVVYLVPRSHADLSCPLHSLN
eukprot:scaffold48536_cov65-Phaeocystis_antarctica.AAC.2